MIEQRWEGEDGTEPWMGYIMMEKMGERQDAEMLSIRTNRPSALRCRLLTSVAPPWEMQRTSALH